MQVLDVKKHEVFMPALSSTMTEGRVVQWLKQPGDKVNAGDPIMVVESDKADMDVECFDSGFLAAIYVDEGESCDVGVTVGVIVDNLDDIDKVKNSAPASATRTAPPDPVKDSSPAPAVAASVVPPAAAASPVAKPDMAEVFMPALSSTMTEGKVVEWYKSEGDPIESGEMVMVVESDKADMDVEAFDSGFLAHISIDAGESCAIGEPVGYIAKSLEDIPAVKAWASSQKSSGTSAAIEAPTASAPAPAEAPAATAAPVPASATATVVNEGRIIASPRAKVVAKEVGIDLRFVAGTGPNGRIVEADVVKAKESGLAGAAPAPSVPVVPAGKVIATPEAKKIAKKEKIDISTVTGTGNFGRITAEDVLKAAGKAPAPKSASVDREQKPPAKEASEKTPLPAGAVVMNSMQKAVVQNMNASLTVPVFRLTYSIKTAALDELYAKVKSKGVTMSALLAKAVAISLAKHPIMNAQYADNSIVYRPDINVAMAVALNDGGLITPTLKNADQTDLYSLSRNWKDLVKRASEKKLSPDEYNSGTFFISNLGMFGVDQFDAILPPGAPGILAIGASKPVVGLQSNGLVGVEKQMSVTLTADHRHVYGADAAKFLKDLTELLEGDVMALLM